MFEVILFGKVATIISPDLNARVQRVLKNNFNRLLSENDSLKAIWSADNTLKDMKPLVSYALVLKIQYSLTSPLV